jgi:uncharacterized protein (DUF2164 family)
MRWILFLVLYWPLQPGQDVREAVLIQVNDIKSMAICDLISEKLTQFHKADGVEDTHKVCILMEEPV